MKIKTSILQEMISKSVKGASNNKLIPITSLIGIEVKNNILTLMTTDGSNHLRIKSNIEANNEDFYTVVNVDVFSKLVGKTTTEFIELTNNENYLNFKGNGNYKLEVPVNEDGEIVKFSEIEITGDEIKLSTLKLKTLLTTLKTSVAKTMEMPCLTGYYLSNNLISTDSQMATYIEDNLFENMSILISSDMAELLQLLDEETVILIKTENKLIFKTSNIIIYGKELEGAEQYPASAITNLMQQNYSYVSKVNKQDLLNILERMELFVGEYDKNGIYLDFKDNLLSIISQKSNAIETIELTNDSSINYNPFNCLIDITMLKSQVQNIVNDIVELHYGDDKSITIVEGNTTIFIALLEK